MFEEFDEGGDDDEGEHDEDAVEFGDMFAGMLVEVGKRPGLSCLFEVTIDVSVAYDGSVSILSAAFCGILLLSLIKL